MTGVTIPDPHWIALYQLQQLIIEDSLGVAAAGGTVEFFKDSNRSVHKPIYELQGNYSSGYTFVQLPNPITLGSAGTFVDLSGADIVVYVVPYVQTGTSPDTYNYTASELYYVVVTAADGTVIFTRGALPANMQAPSSGSGGTVAALSENAISNPQFVEVNFQPAQSPGLMIPVTGTMTSSVIPDWDIVTTGTGSVTVIQLPVIDGATPTNPPYALDIASTGITTIVLQQTLKASPTIFWGSQVSFSFVGYKTGGGSAACTAIYQPSNGMAYTQAVTITGATYVEYFVNFSVIGTENTDGAPAGNVTIQLSIPPSTELRLTSFQLVISPSASANPAYLQESTARQQDHLFHYWQPKLNFKPIPSYTIGWDFGFNPCQELGTTVSAASGLSANNARYIADQTIAFESVQNVMNYSFGPGGMQATSGSTTTQFALIQYLGQTSAFEILSQRNSIKLRGNVSSGSVTGQVNIYWSANSGPSVPVIPASLITSLTAGVPTVASGWTAVPRQAYGPANFTLNSSTNSDFDFSWFDATAVNTSTATAIAVVVSFNAITSAQTVGIDYISLVPGDIPTPPAPLSAAQTLTALQTYYETSFLGSQGQGTYPVTYASTNVGALISPQIQASFGAQMIASPWGFTYRVVKRADPNNGFIGTNNGTVGYVTPVIYAATGGIEYSAPDIPIGSLWSQVGSNANGVQFYGTAANVAAGAGGSGNYVGSIRYQYYADARFGVV